MMIEFDDVVGAPSVDWKLVELSTPLEGCVADRGKYFCGRACAPGKQFCSLHRRGPCERALARWSRRMDRKAALRERAKERRRREVHARVAIIRANPEHALTGEDEKA
jgi:hypothetical protein